MLNDRSEDMLMALLAAEADIRSDERAASAMPTLDERVDMFVRGFAAGGVVTEELRAFAREQILNAMAADLADATVDFAPSSGRRAQSVPHTNSRLAAVTVKPVARIPAPVAVQTSSGVLAGLQQLLAPFTVRRLSFAAVPLVALVIAGSLWNETWLNSGTALTGGESPQQQEPHAGAPAKTRGIGPQRADTDVEQNLRRTIADEESANGRSSPALVSKLVDLAVLYRADGRLREAQALGERALIIADRALGAQNPATIRTINELAAIYRGEGRSKDADALLSRPNQP